jgi:acyl transferase domain-containing protein
LRWRWGLSALWRSWGVEPSAVVGHSLGEVAAAHVAGALTLEDGARIICRRSRLLKRVSGQGAMGLVELGLAEASEALKGYEGPAIGGGEQRAARDGAVGGASGAGRGDGEAGSGGVFCRRVKVEVASHSPQMDGLRAELLEQLGGLAPRAASVPLYSTVTNEVSVGTELGASYW